MASRGAQGRHVHPHALVCTRARTHAHTCVSGAPVHSGSQLPGASRGAAAGGSPHGRGKGRGSPRGTLRTLSTTFHPALFFTDLGDRNDKHKSEQITAFARRLLDHLGCAHSAVPGRPASPLLCRGRGPPREEKKPPGNLATRVRDSIPHDLMTEATQSDCVFACYQIREAKSKKHTKNYATWSLGSVLRVRTQLSGAGRHQAASWKEKPGRHSSLRENPARLRPHSLASDGLRPVAGPSKHRLTFSLPQDLCTGSASAWKTSPPPP